jgi:hypothetical protein
MALRHAPATAMHNTSKQILITSKQKLKAAQSAEENCDAKKSLLAPEREGFRAP